MPSIYLDESGDLGFDFSKRKTSKFFVVTLMFVDEKRPVEKVVRKVHAGLRKKYRMRGGVLHAFHEEPETNTRFCKKLSKKPIRIMAVYLNKAKVYTRLHDEKIVLYNYVTNILLDRIITKGLIDVEKSIELVASRRETNKFLNANFAEYLSRQVRSNHNVHIDVVIKTPHEEKCLQAVDVASWALFRKYEYGDDVYYQILKSVIVEENPLFG